MLYRGTVAGQFSLPFRHHGLSNFDLISCGSRINKVHGSFSDSTQFGASVSENESERNGKSERNLGILVLLTVPLAWGTFEPAVRYVYAIDPPVPSLVFTVGYYLVASLSLSLLAIASIIREDKDVNAALDDKGSRAENPSLLDEDVENGLPIRGGIELGTYLFLGNGFQVLGLKTVPADRAAFLLQLTTVRATVTDNCRPIFHCTKLRAPHAIFDRCR